MADRTHRFFLGFGPFHGAHLGNGEASHPKRMGFAPSKAYDRNVPAEPDGCAALLAEPHLPLLRAPMRRLPVSDIRVNYTHMNIPARRPYAMTARAAAANATHRRILAAATEAFLARPYEQVSLENVAVGAGVTVQTVLRRFRSKEGLVAAAAEVGLAEVRARRDLAPIGDLAGAARHLVDHYEEWGQRVLRMLAQEEQVPAFRNVTDAGRTLHRRWVERTFAPWLRVARAARSRRLVQLTAVTDVFVWKLLRQDQGLSRNVTEATLVDLLERITGVP